jgi:hypothetical protein
MPVTEIKSPTKGTVGWLHEVECEANDSILVFQLPRATNQLSNVYVDGAKETIQRMLPPGRSALVIGADINIYELAGPDALLLKIKGLI